MTDGYIYFIKPVGMRGPVKIGFSNSPERRLLDLAGWSPFELEIVVTIPGTMALETNIHDCLWSAHSHHEWFRPTKAVIALVDALKHGASIERAINLNARERSSKAARLAGRRIAPKQKRSPEDFTFVDKFVARYGSQSKAAEAIGVSQVSISKMVRRGQFTAKTAIAVDGLTRGELPVWLTRPDLWDPPAEAIQ